MLLVHSTVWNILPLKKAPNLFQSTFLDALHMHYNYYTYI